MPQTKKVLLDSLQKFYSDPAHFAILSSIVNSSRKKHPGTDEENTEEEEDGSERMPYGCVSLRVIDYFASEYASVRNVQYWLDGGTVPFLVYQSYSQTARNHGKNNFDAFARNKREVLKCQGQEVETTCGQANLLRWAIRHRVLDYIVDNISDIRSHLKASTRKRAERKARDAKAMHKPVGVSKVKKGRSKLAHRVCVAPVCFSHHADKPIYKYKFGF